MSLDQEAVSREHEKMQEDTMKESMGEETEDQTNPLPHLLLQFKPRRIPRHNLPLFLYHELWLSCIHLHLRMCRILIRQLRQSMRVVGGVVLFLVLRVVRVGWEARVAWVGIYRIRVVPPPPPAPSADSHYSQHSKIVTDSGM